MVVVYILLIFFAAIFAIPIKFKAVYNDYKFSLTVMLFSFKFGLNSKDSKIEKQNAKIDLKKIKFNKKKIKLFLKLFKCFYDFLSDVIKKIKIKKLFLKIDIGSSDAFDCAANYSRVIFILNSISCFVPRNSEIKILPNFLCEKTEYKFEIVVKIFLYHILTLILKLAFQCTKLLLVSRK